MATAPMLLIFASCHAFFVMATRSEVEPFPIKDFQFRDFGGPNQLPYPGYRPEDEMLGAYAPGQEEFTKQMEEILAPSPGDKDYDSLKAVAELMQADMDLAKARPELLPVSAQELAKAQILANNPDKLVMQILNDTPAIAKTMDSISPGASKALPPMPPNISEFMLSAAMQNEVMTTGEEYKAAAFSGAAISPASGESTSPVSSASINPVSGAPINPVSGASINPVSDASINPVSDASINPVSGALINPVSVALINPVLVTLLALLLF